MADIRYTKEHEYIIVEEDIGTVGISNHAQEQLGDIVFVELPETGQSFQKGDEIAVVESVKAASEIYSPVDGEVINSNQELSANPGLVNQEPEAQAWFFKIKISDKGQLDEHMDAAAYAKYLEEIS